MLIMVRPCFSLFINFKPWDRHPLQLARHFVCYHLKSYLQIRGFPTIKIFQKGEDPVDYDGGRTKADIVARALDLFSENAPPPELLEVLPSC